jgi:hypothetical protein
MTRTTAFRLAAGLAILLAPAVHASIVASGAGSGSSAYALHAGIPPLPVGSGLAYDPAFTGGVRVAVGDVTGDGIPDLITGTGAGSSHVKVFDGVNGSVQRSFLSYGGFAGGVYVASGDIDGDGFADIITGAGPGGGPHVKVFSGQSGAELNSFFPYTPSFQGGVRVAVGDIDGDGVRDIITGAGPGGNGHITAFSGVTGASISSFFAFGPAFTGGVHVAAGDVNGDGRADFIVGAEGSSHVKIFSGATGAELQSFFAFGGFTGGVRVASGDINGDGRADIIMGQGDGGSLVRIMSGLDGSDLATFSPLPGSSAFGVYVGADGGPIPAPAATLLFAFAAAATPRRRR